MTDEVLRDRERPGRSSTGMPQQVAADPAQLLTGLVLELPTDHVVCLDCGAHLTEGQAVTVYCSRSAEHSEWELRRWYCTACSPATIEAPTLGVTELLARAHLGTVALPGPRTHRYCLVDVELVGHSPPRDGGRV